MDHDKNIRTDEIAAGFGEDSLPETVAKLLADQAGQMLLAIQSIIDREVAKARAELDRQANARHGQIRECSEMLQRIGHILEAEPPTNAMWLQFCVEVSYNHKEPLERITDELCASFQQVATKQGKDIARALFEMPSGILPSEIIGAGLYLHGGGSVAFVPEMAANGAFELGVDKAPEQDAGQNMS